MENLRIAFPNFWPKFSQTNNFFYNTLKQDHNLIIDYSNPQLVLFSVFGSDYHKRYSNDIKVFYTGENIQPDYSVCDKSLSFNRIESPQNMRLPLWFLYIDHFGISAQDCSPSYLIDKNNLFQKINNSQEHFCGFVFSNGAGERVPFFNQMSKYSIVTAGGPLFNNYPKIKEGELNKLNFLQKCKFSCCFENSSTDGYLTEKLLHGLVSGGVPLYWGDPNSRLDFNHKRYLSLHDYSDLESFCDHVIQIDKEAYLYNEFLEEPIFTPDQLIKFNNYIPTVKSFLVWNKKSC